MSDTDDDARRARGWREQYLAVSGPSVLLDAPHVACGREEWEPVPGAPGVPRLVGAWLQADVCHLLMVRWVRRVCEASDG